MREIVDKLQKLELEIAREKGPLRLFALFQRQGGFGLWDVVVSAPWADKNEAAAIKYVAKKMRKALRPKDMERISCIAIVVRKNPGLDELQRRVQVKHGLVEIQNVSFFEKSIEHAYIITSQKRAA